MNLLDRSVKYLAVAMLLVLSVWSVVFYVNLREEVYESIDDGLENHKELILHRLKTDSTILMRTDFRATDYAITLLDRKVKGKDQYQDTVMYLASEGEKESVRLLTTSFKYKGQHYRMKLYASTVEEDDLVEGVLWAVVMLYVVLLITTIVVNRILLRRIWEPFQAILKELGRFRVGKHEQLRDVPTDVREFQDLKTVTNTLVKRASAAYKDQRAFTENAAHELQTPLAIGINRLELLADKGDLNEEQTAAVAQVIGILQRSVRLNRSLLLLARIENRQFPNTQDVPLGQVCQRLIEEFQPFAEFKQVTITLVEAAPFVRSMDPDLAHVLVTNLVKNAIVHNVAGGSVRIEVNGGELSITNSGADLPLDATRIFDRFRKETKEEGGTGLGLSIAKAIATLYGFTLTYTFADGHRMILRG